MASDRQKYNFLAAWVKQLDQAMDDHDDLADQAREVINNLMERSDGELGERVASCEQWLAELDAAVEELESEGSLDSGEEPEPNDDGDHDTDVGTMEPAVRGVPEGHRRVAPDVGGASDGESSGRSRVTKATRERISRGT